MNRDFTLQQNEQIYFKRQATLEKNGAMGIIYVTTLRFAWIPIESTMPNFVMSWGALESDKYKTGKNGFCAIRIKAMSGDAKEFYLGEATKANTIEIDNLRNAVKKAVSQPGAATNRIAAPPSRASKSGSVINTANAVTESKKRELLLEADGVLRDKYNDMVRGGIIDEEEFWSNHAYLFNSDTSGRGKGVVSSLLADKAGKRSLNPEIIAEIFATKPVVKKVYDEKVPHDMTEDEFWQKYFLSEMFTRTDHTGSNSSASRAFSLNPRRELRTDDMFTRAMAEERAKNRQAATSSSGSCIGKKRPHASLDVDLTVTYNDYHESEPLDPEDFSLHREMSAVLEKYARKSETVMRTQLGDARDGGDRSTWERPFSEWGKDRLGELEDSVGLDVVPLNLSSSTNRAMSSTYPSSAHITRPTDTRVLSPHKILSTLSDIFPDSERAQKAYLRGIKDLNAVTDRARKDAMHSGSGVSSAALTNSKEVKSERMEVPAGFEEVCTH